MKKFTHQPMTLTGKVWCSIFGHRFVTTRKVTDYFREYKCVHCQLELTNDEQGRRIFLTPEHKAINETLVHFYQKRHHLTS
ncbi:hypothetical protein G4D82_03285 [Flavobacterium sp. CYK-4]|uniref:hypothetical protein n=1 Tax=Flavobacterium lotistagni TaxID=2709660 RepID=UPI00140A8628|nr:hypothetical protein [Flavobacterium lotistagni]NHM06232.1 hypothetical protein [Flavobacterium lotistagni]